MKTMRFLLVLVLVMAVGVCYAQQEYEIWEKDGWTFCDVKEGVMLSGESVNAVYSSVSMASTKDNETQLYVDIWGMEGSTSHDIVALENVAKSTGAYEEVRSVQGSISLCDGKTYNGLIGYKVNSDGFVFVYIVFNLERMAEQGGKLNTAPTIKSMLKTLAERIPGRYVPKDGIQANPQETETIERLDPAIAAKDSANVSESSSDSGSGVSRQLKEMAANGDAKTQYELGHQYAINNDFDEAAKWYTKAANQGCGEAQGELAMFYLDGRGVEKDETQAAYWIKQWAAQGDALGQLWLGKFYYNGIGVGQDFTTAVLWFEKSAEQGNMDAIFSLGLCHYEGKGTVKDYNKAFSLFQRAANVNDPNQVSTSAMIYLSKCYANGQGTTKDMNKAHQWMERAAQMGDADAQEALQEM